MNILVIGDVVGSVGCEFLRSKLPNLKRIKGIDLVIANGENSADGNGITPKSAEYLYDSGVDVITTGNHTYRRKEIYEYFDTQTHLIRPANYPDSAPGKGICIVDMGRIRVAVMNIMGTVYLENLRCPFETLDRLLGTEDLPKICILDFHAEATGEKRALGYYADGKLSAIFGTHTHVQTADACILPAGTGYITDTGMTGPIESALGVKSELVIQKFLTKLPVRFENAPGPCKMDCTLFTVDEASGLCTAAERMCIT